MKRDAQRLNEEALAYEFGFEKKSKLLVANPIPAKKRLLIGNQKKGPIKDRFIETDNVTEKTSPPSNVPVSFGPFKEPVSKGPPDEVLLCGPSSEPESNGPSDEHVNESHNESLSNELNFLDSSSTFIPRENVHDPISESTTDTYIFDLDQTQDNQLIELLSEQRKMMKKI